MYTAVTRTIPAMTAAVAILTVLSGCAVPTVKPTGSQPPSRAESAEFWVDPGPDPRNLQAGVGGRHERPGMDQPYDVISTDTRGFSITYRVKDRRGSEWNVKIGPEAQTRSPARRPSCTLCRRARRPASAPSE